MNDIITIIEADRDVLVVEKENTRLSDAIDDFKNSETNVFNPNLFITIAISGITFYSIVCNYGYSNKLQLVGLFA